MLARMVSIPWPCDPPTSASQSAGITGVSDRARPVFLLLKEFGYFPCSDDKLFWTSRHRLWYTSMCALVEYFNPATQRGVRASGEPMGSPSHAQQFSIVRSTREPFFCCSLGYQHGRHCVTAFSSFVGVLCRVHWLASGFRFAFHGD